MFTNQALASTEDFGYFGSISQQALAQQKTRLLLNSMYNANFEAENFRVVG
jgi:hypothetical protein